jgi:phosphatidylserine/phosphatidylglycerophosphate/cardiolipin synthase-like enzyme
MTNGAASKKYQFYAAAEYWQLLPSYIAETKAGDRLALMTMDFDPTGPYMQGINDAILQAAKRGVNVWLVIDAHSLWHDAQKQALTNINAQASGHALIINRPKHSLKSPLAIAGRSHIKFSVINDIVFLGGCNLASEQLLDVMVAQTNPTLADYLYDLVATVYHAKHVGRALHWQDKRLDLDATTSLLIDAGTSRQSAILDQALQLIDGAETSITIAGQLFPNGVTGQHLAAARTRGVAVHIVFSPPSAHVKTVKLSQYYSLWREKLRLSPELFAEMLPKGMHLLHAKMLVTDKGSLLGSHNLVRAGVVLGTAEIALLTSDPAFGEGALAALGRQVPLRA